MSSITNAVKLKSKTINLNALYLAVVAILPALGYDVAPETIAAGQTLLNVILRFVTNNSLCDK